MDASDDLDVATDVVTRLETAAIRASGRAPESGTWLGSFGHAMRYTAVWPAAFDEHRATTIRAPSPDATAACSAGY
jgi:hypothetical protein